MDLAQRIAAGDLRALARAATYIENRDARGEEVLRALEAGGVREPLVLGVTGSPGAGKSTLVDRVARAYRQAGRTVAIVAVDPSSATSGGALLGDRIRMQSGLGDPGLFVRSMATRGAHGGLAAATANLVRLFGAAGRDVVIVETVGVGQAEVDVARLAQITLVVLVPGMGDDVQAIKAGIMEIADIFVINKADHAGADQVENEVRAVLAMNDRAGPPPEIVRTVATRGEGVPELLAAIGRAPRRTRTFAPARGHAIDHLGIAVESIEAALAFYRDQLGLTVASRETVEVENVHVAMLPAGESRIELLEPASPGSVIAKFLEKRGPGLHHVALRVPDLAAAVERLRAGGARLLNEPRQGAGGHEYVFVHPASTGGVLLELIQDAQ